MEPGDEPARILEIISPAGFERFFAELGERIAAGAHTFEDGERLAAAFGPSFDTTWVPDLVERFEPNPPG